MLVEDVAHIHGHYHHRMTTSDVIDASERRLVTDARRIVVATNMIIKINFSIGMI